VQYCRGKHVRWYDLIAVLLCHVVSQEAAKVLLAHGADASIRNHEGQAVTEFDDVSAELLALF